MIAMRPDWNEIKEFCAAADVFSFESVPYRERRLLPKLPGIYFFVQGSCVLYIGQSKNIRARCENHDKVKGIGDLSGVRIHWTKCRPQELLFTESEFLKKYRPSLNLSPFCYSHSIVIGNPGG